jgi:hypothetical protein
VEQILDLLGQAEVALTEAEMHMKRLPIEITRRMRNIRSQRERFVEILIERKVSFLRMLSELPSVFGLSNSFGYRCFGPAFELCPDRKADTVRCRKEYGSIPYEDLTFVELAKLPSSTTVSGAPDCWGVYYQICSRIIAEIRDHLKKINKDLEETERFERLQLRFHELIEEWQQAQREIAGSLPTTD